MLETAVTSKIVPLVLAGMFYMMTIIPFPSNDFKEISIVNRDLGAHYSTWIEIDNAHTKQINIKVIKPNKVHMISVYRKNKSLTYISNPGHKYDTPEDKETGDYNEFLSWITDKEKAAIDKVVKGGK